MSFNNVLIIIILIIALCETAAISCVKQYHLHGNMCYLMIAILLYAIVCFLLDKSFYYSTMGITNVIWSGVSILVVSLAGLLLFKEKIHVHDVIAGILITIGILIFKFTE